MHNTATTAESDASNNSRCSTPSSPTHIDDEFPADVPLLRSCENCRRKKRKCSGNRPA
ncbi:hypothetical protein LPJ71_009758, partial [Coemansia sp. S17]